MKSSLSQFLNLSEDIRECHFLYLVLDVSEGPENIILKDSEDVITLRKDCLNKQEQMRINLEYSLGSDDINTYNSKNKIDGISVPLVDCIQNTFKQLGK